MRMALLGLCLLCACQSTAKRVRVPMFVGKPVISSLRPEIVALHALGAPKPAVRRLQLAVRVTANGKPLGESTERIGQTSDGFGEYVEEGSYRATDGRCSAGGRRGRRHSRPGNQPPVAQGPPLLRTRCATGFWQ